MKPILFLLGFASIYASGQFDTYTQYFDGADTGNLAIEIYLDTSNENLWQIGPPQKNLFQQAFTPENVIITDTINAYPANRVSSFTYSIVPEWGWGILALRWTQKLDMIAGLDGGYVSYSIDSGATWTNAFNSPYVYNYYGFDAANVDTLDNGEIVFSGQDTTWKDVWLCFDYSWLSSATDSILFRHTFISDSIGGKEGWMIDNMMRYITGVHTVGEVLQEEYVRVFPNPTDGIVNIQVRKMNAYHIVEQIRVLDESGHILAIHQTCPTKFYIDLSEYPSGLYYIEVQTNLETVTKKVILTH